MKGQRHPLESRAGQGPALRELLFLLRFVLAERRRDAQGQQVMVEPCRPGKAGGRRQQQREKYSLPLHRRLPSAAASCHKAGACGATDRPVHHAGRMHLDSGKIRFFHSLRDSSPCPWPTATASSGTTANSFPGATPPPTSSPIPCITAWASSRACAPTRPNRARQSSACRNTPNGCSIPPTSSA